MNNPNPPPHFNDSPDAERAAALQREIETVMKRHGVPAVCVVLIPDTEGAIRASYALRTSSRNIFAIIPIITEYMRTLAAEAAISEQHRRENNS